MTIKYNYHRPACAFFLALFAVAGDTPPPVWAQAPASATTTNSPATNVPSPAPLWSPTEEQKQLESGGRFLTVTDPAHGQVHHRVLNATPPIPKEGSTFNFTRSVLANGGSAYAVEVIVNRPLTQPALFFDGLKSIEFLADGERFACPTFSARVQSEKIQGGGAVAWRAYYGAKASEELVRALGRAKQASVTVPCKNGPPWERKFSPDDLARLATFVRVYLPKPGGEK